MIIDIPTMLTASGAVVAISGVSFILNNVLRRSDPVGRTWSVAFVFGILTTLSYAVWGLAPESWWAVAVGNAALPLAIGAMWSGCRQFNGRAALYWIAIASSVIVGLAALVEGPTGGAWAGAGVLFVATAAFAALAAVESLSGRMKRTVNARLLTVVFWLVAVYYAARTVVLVVDGKNGTVFLSFFGTVTTTFVTIVLVILAAISMSVLTSSRVSHDDRISGASSIAPIEGVAPPALFDQQARDWLLRAQRDRDGLVLLFLDIDNLEHMNTAFGREFGDMAIVSVGRIACENAPSAALVGQAGARRFAVLTSAPSVGSATAVAEQLQTALVETPVDTLEGIRALATCGIATTDTVGYDLVALQKSAKAAMREAYRTSPGSIGVGTALQA